MAKTTGVFGGTFDPPHNGHLAVVKAVLGSDAVDDVLIPVAADPWQKTSLGLITPFSVRYEMTVAAFAGMDNVTVSDVELELQGRSYTIDLLQRVSQPEIIHKPIIGADAASALATWNRIDKLAQGWEFVVINRPGHEITVPDYVRYESIEMEPIDISSTDIRIAVSERRDIDSLVSDSVSGLISAHNLYT